MQGLVSSRTTAIAVALLVLLLLIAGFLLTRQLGRRMGAARRNAHGDVNRILSDLAAAMGGRFEEGARLIDHPLLGDLRTYGTARVTRGPLAIAVGVSYPADDLRDDRTTVRVQRPPDRRWRVATLHQRRRAPASIDPGKVDAQLARCFELSDGGALPADARRALLQAGARTFSIDLDGGALDVVAAPEGDTAYIADVARLRALVDELAALAEALLVPAAA